MSTLLDMLNKLSQGDSEGAQEEFNAVMAEKAALAVEVMKQDVARNMFDEEVEQIDELSKSTLGNYVKKAAENMGNKAAEAGHYNAKAPKPGYGVDGVNAYRAMEKARKRQVGIGKAIDKMTKEEVEQIDETSLGRKVAVGYRAGQRVADALQMDKDLSNAGASNLVKNDVTGKSKLAKTISRTGKVGALAAAVGGVAQALKNHSKPRVSSGESKLTREEVEQIDEISAETKASYVQKATQQVKDLKPWTKKGEYKDIAANIVDRRKRGLALAKEDVEQVDEAKAAVDGGVETKKPEVGTPYTRSIRDIALSIARNHAKVISAKQQAQMRKLRKEEVSEETEQLEESTAARELVLHANNDADLHRQSHIPIIANLKRKVGKGVYDHEKAKKLWGYHADRAAQSYAKQHGDKNTPWHKMFSTADRKAAAAKFADAAREEIGVNEETQQEPPFEPNVPPKKKIAIPGKAGYGMSAAKHLARLGLKKQMQHKDK